MFSYTKHPGADGVGVAFTDAETPSGDPLDLGSRAADPGKGWELVRTALGVGLFYPRQVHGTNVVEVLDDTSPEEVALVEADALVTRRRGAGLAVRVADCLPVLFADPDAGVVAAAHAGRVGLAAGVLPATLARMRELGAIHVTAWIGPHVCGACYEVPEAMRDELGALLPGAASVTSWGTPALDLGAAAALQLEREGCVVELHDPCTRTTQSLHSHRRDGLASGRQAGIVWLA